MNIITPQLDVSLMQNAFECAKSSAFLGNHYDGIHHFMDAPTLSKSELVLILRNNFDLRAERKGVYLVRSGGSTQAPLIFPVDIEENQQLRVALATSLKENKVITPQTIALNIFGYSDLYRTASILDDILEKCDATTLAVSAHATHADILATAKHFQPDFIMGTPSKLLLFAKYLEANGQKIVVSDVLYGGEFLRPSLQDFLRQTFHANNFWSLYGSAETGIWAWSAVSQTPSLFHVLNGIVVEIIEPDELGYGMLAVTNTYRKRFPVFRYLIGDVGRWVLHNNSYLLELKSRESKSFVFFEQHYSLDELQNITYDVETYQVQLSTDENSMDELKLLLVKQMRENERDAYIENKSAQLQQLIQHYPKGAKVVAALVESAMLYINPVTGKMPLVLDNRN